MKLENLNRITIQIEYKDIVEKTCKETIEKIKANARAMEIGGNKYINDWTYGIEQVGNDYLGVVYNEDHYRLSHLLEHAHLIKNKYGSYGYTAPREHIKPAFDVEKDKYIDRMAKATYEITNK